ncbi:MAG: hypothetical protein PWR24_1499 [Desulfonauticus sp.]|jgi:hypothetical protein|nr:hypothetical protein [Desulfonauticus sp.]
MNKLDLITSLLPPLVKVWGKSLRYQRVEYDNYLSLKKQGQKVLFSIWHGEIFPLIYLHQKQNIIALASPSRDGELIARVLKKFGFLLARGSSSKTGVKALVSLLKEFKKNPNDIVLTVDGPRGPRHKIKEGIFYLAYKLKLPIIPVRTRCSLKYTFNSWDKFELPLPFSSCIVKYGKPFWISSLSDKDISNYKKELEEYMENKIWKT